MTLRKLKDVNLRALVTATTPCISRFRRWRLFLPVVVAVPVLAFSGAVGGYAAWDVTRVSLPDVVGTPWPASIAALASLGLEIDKGEASDETIGEGCYVVSSQGVPADTRVVPDETVIDLQVELDNRHVPDVVGLSVGEARELLLSSCFHDAILPTWCVPENFSGGVEMLVSEEFSTETGMNYDATSHLLSDAELIPDDHWTVCDQAQKASTMREASSAVGLSITVPLTTVPEPAGDALSQARSALQATADGCTLSYSVAATFKPDPTAIQGNPLPGSAETDTWRVLDLQPTIGRPALCGTDVAIGVEWPSTAMPKLIGLHHVLEESSEASTATLATATPATAALEKASLISNCSGRGTVTSQVPDVGALVPRGTAVICVAELVVPSIVGLDETTAKAVLVRAGIEGFGSGSGVVVSQSLAAGSIATSMQSVWFEAEPPPRVFTPSTYYKNCTAARAAGAAPVYRGDPGYGVHLDRDRDGIGCE